MGAYELQEVEQAWPNDTLYYTDATTDTEQVIQLEAYQTNVFITLSDGTNTATATLILPPVADAKGKTYSIIVLDAAGGVTLTDYPNASYNDSVNWDGDYTLDANNDKITLFCDGRRWTVVENAIA